MKKIKTSLIFEFFHLRCQNHLTLTLFSQVLSETIICETQKRIMERYVKVIRHMPKYIDAVVK